MRARAGPRGGGQVSDQGLLGFTFLVTMAFCGFMILGIGFLIVLQNWPRKPLRHYGGDQEPVQYRAIESGSEPWRRALPSGERRALPPAEPVHVEVVQPRRWEVGR